MFQKDIWLGELPLKELYPRIHTILNQKRLKLEEFEERHEQQ